MNWRVLIVEDDLACQSVMQMALEKLPLKIECASDGQTAKKLLSERPYDLVLLDIGLPDGDGRQLCSELRNDQLTKDLLIFFISGWAEIQDKVAGFSLGADDYITKPFDARELRARVESKLKRFKAGNTNGQYISKGDLKLNLPMQQAYVFDNGQQMDLSLTPSEFRLLYYLISHEGEILTRDQLLEAIWEQQGVHVLKRTVDRHIATLRKKIGERTYRIQTVSRIGYRFCDTGLNLS